MLNWTYNGVVWFQSIGWEERPKPIICKLRSWASFWVSWKSIELLDTDTGTEFMKLDELALKFRSTASVGHPKLPMPLSADDDERVVPPSNLALDEPHQFAAAIWNSSAITCESWSASFISGFLSSWLFTLLILHASSCACVGFNKMM